MIVRRISVLFHSCFVGYSLRAITIVGMVTIGTWNLENFFRPGSGGPKTKGEYAKKLNALSGVLTDLAPDVLAVQEVGAPEALTDLADNLGGSWKTELAEPGGSEFGTKGYDRADMSDATRLWNTAGLIPEEERYTRIYRGRRESIDHIMISHALTESVEEVTTGGGDVSSVSDSPGQRNYAEA